MEEHHRQRPKQDLLVSDIGEAGLIARITQALGAPPPGETWGGDDAAVIAAPGELLLYTTDMLVAGVDFDLAWCSGVDVGWKSVAVNVSDIAAMGGRASHALVGLGLQPNLPVSIVDDLVAGVTEAAGLYGVGLAGGDITRSEELTVSVAMIGAPAAGRAALRSGALPGEAICVTGSLGGASAGLRLLTAGVVDDRSTGPVARVVARQLRPRARAEEGVALARAGVSAMIDVSDGLLADLGHLLDASGAGCDLDPELIPVDPDISGAGAARGEELDPLSLALTGGEDFELLFTMKTAAQGPEAVQSTRIGTVTPSGRRLGDRPLADWKEGGWDHLADP